MVVEAYQLDEGVARGGVDQGGFCYQSRLAVDEVHVVAIIRQSGTIAVYIYWWDPDIKILHIDPIISGFIFLQNNHIFPLILDDYHSVSIGTHCHDIAVFCLSAQ